jgi:hypothetical protein
VSARTAFRAVILALSVLMDFDDAGCVPAWTGHVKLQCSTRHHLWIEIHQGNAVNMLSPDIPRWNSSGGAACTSAKSARGRNSGCQ